jgi:hypothetical protein
MSALGIAEQLTHHVVRATRARPVNVFGEPFFTGARLPDQQDGGVRGGHLVRHVERATNRWTAAGDELGRLAGRHLFPQIHVLAFQAVAEPLQLLVRGP